MAMVNARKGVVMAWDLSNIREEVKNLLGKKVTVEAHSSKKKEYTKECFLDVVSQRVFTVKIIETGLYKSFSYKDIVDGSVRLYT